MERTLIAFNVPNFITLNLMVWGGFLLIGLAYQLATRGRGGGRDGAQAAAVGSGY